MASKCMKIMRDNLLLIATLIGVIIGIGMGIGMRYAGLSYIDIQYFSFPGDMLLRMLKMIILPLIFCSMVTGLLKINYLFNLFFLIIKMIILPLIFCSMVTGLGTLNILITTELNNVNLY